MPAPNSKENVGSMYENTCKNNANEFSDREHFLTEMCPAQTPRTARVNLFDALLLARKITPK
jgi:hypothetical protein